MNKNKLIGSVFMKAGIGFLITMIVAFMTSSLYGVLIPKSTGGAIAVLIGTMILLFFALYRVNANISNKNLGSVRFWFYLVTIIFGVLMSSITVYYPLSTIISATGLTVLFMFIMGFIGYTTKKDLSGVGRMASIGLIIVIILSVIMMFLPIPGLNLGLNIAILVIFAGYTMYDVQKIKNVPDNRIRTELDFKLISYRYAVDIYLDIINVFKTILRLFGND